MSVFLTRQQRLGGRIRRLQTRGVVSNPALNTNPAFRNPAIIPFGIEFVDEGLRQELNEADSGLVDQLETLYYRQCQEDAELNSAQLPRTYESPLWGFIYGQRLVSAQTQLDTLDDDERFMTNYLKETIAELSMRMNRFYPALDYAAQVSAAKAELAVEPDAAYTASYNKALRELIVEDPQRFVALFKNNAFIGAEADNVEDDKFGDFLPERVEQELTGQFEYSWDANSTLTDNFSGYFARISRLEGVVAPKVDSLSKNLRANFAGFLLRCFEQGQLQKVQFVVDLVRSAAPSVISVEVDGVAKDEVARRNLALLEEMSSAPPLLSKLFFGDAKVDAQLTGKSKEELVGLLQNVDEERLVLINRALQVYDYLKYNSMTRLLLTCLIKSQSEYFGQFLNAFSGEANIEQFEADNNAVLDEAVSSLSLFYEAQEDVSKALEALLKAVQSEVSGEVSLDFSAFAAPPCFVVGALDDSYAAAKERGDLLGQIRYSTLSKYVAGNADNISGLSLLVFLMNPARNGVDGDSLKRLAFQFATNASGATDTLFEQVVGAMQQRAQLESSAANAFKSSLVSTVDSELEQLRSACGAFDTSRGKLETALCGLRLNFADINFDHAKSNYDPLSTYLAQFRYYNNR